MNWYEKERSEVLSELGADAASGLSSSVVLERKGVYGSNQFDEQKGESVIKKILHHLRDVSTLILIFAALMSMAMEIYHGEGLIEFLVIIGIVILNMTLAITQERSAEKSLAALKNLNSPTSLVLRDGAQAEIDSVDLTPGDILLLKAGNMVSADARLLESVDLAVDESALTGESMPAVKNAEDALAGKIAVADQTNMVFSGCLVTAGRATAVVTSIGMGTQMGRIAGYLNNTQKIKTPLQNRIDNIGKIISVVAIIAALAMFFIGFIRGADIWEMIFVAVSLAVAAVPETLSLIVTLTLSHGVTEMVKKNALIRKLPAVETLGSTSVICTDKTGTLTQNKMKIKRLWMEGGEPFVDAAEFTQAQADFLNRLALPNNAVIETGPNGERKIIGSPTEAAVIRLLADKYGIGAKNALRNKYPRVAEISFSSERKMISTINKDPDGGYMVLTCGAYDRVPFLPADAETIKERDAVHDAFANDALRIIALGYKHIDELPDMDNLGEVEKDLEFKGLIGIIDPPRPECADAVAAAKKAGIRTVMITGDHAVTAGAIARQIGILSEGDKILTGLELSDMGDDELIENVSQYSVYARVSPEDKIRIVQAWQEYEEVVAMTGDGVNDAPALKAADVGVAMGIAGTEVAKSAADMILTDDNFSTIIEAVRKGRDVFSNIRKTVYFLSVCNFSEIVIMLGAMLFGWAMPLTPIMLLLINVIGDGIPGLSLAREKSDPRLMLRRPIGRCESLFNGLQLVITKQIIAFVAVAWIGYYIGAYAYLTETCDPSHIIGQTMCFLIVGWTSILHIFTVRTRKSVFRSSFRDNPRIVYSAFAMIALFALMVMIPPVASVFGMQPIAPIHWLIVAAFSIVPTLSAEAGKFFMNRAEIKQYSRRLVRHTYEN